MSKKKGKDSKRLKDIHIYSLLSLIAFGSYLGFKYYSGQASGSGGSEAVQDTIVSLLIFIVDTFTIFLAIAWLIVAVTVLSVMVFRRKILGLPKDIYPYYKQRLKHGKSLIKSGKKEKFDSNTPVPESITAKKFARLYYQEDTGSLVFRPIVNSTTTYGLREKAVCYKHLKEESHSPPEEDCRCGFYGLRSFDELIAGFEMPGKLLSRVLLTCNMYGKIKEASNGFRAALQQVLSIEFFKHCYICAKKHPEKSVMASKIAIHKSSVGISDVIRGESLLIPVCNQHTLDIERSWTIQDIRDKLKVDVDWYEITPL